MSDETAQTPSVDPPTAEQVAPDTPAPAGTTPAPRPAPAPKWVVRRRNQVESVILGLCVFVFLLGSVILLYSQTSSLLQNQLRIAYPCAIFFGAAMSVGTGALHGFPERQQDHAVQMMIVGLLPTFIGYPFWSRFVSLAAAMAELNWTNSADYLIGNDLAERATFYFGFSSALMVYSGFSLGAPVWASGRTVRVAYTFGAAALGLLAVGFQVNDRTTFYTLAHTPEGFILNTPLTRSNWDTPMQLAVAIDPKGAKSASEVNLLRTHCSIVSHPICDRPTNPDSNVYETRVRSFLQQESWRLVAGYLRDTAVTNPFLAPLIKGVKQQLLREPAPSAPPPPAASPSAQPLSAEL